MASSLGTLIQGLIEQALPGFSRAPEFEETRNVLAFEDRRQRRLLRIELGRPKNHVWFIAIDYTTKPTLAELLDRGLRSSNFETAEIGPLPTENGVDQDRVARWVNHLSVNWQLLDAEDPFKHRFFDAFSLSKEDQALGSESIRTVLRDAVFALRGDVQRSRLTLPLGTLSVEQNEAFVSAAGEIPPFARLILDTEIKGSGSEWFPVNTISFPTGFYMSTHAREALFADFFASAESALAEGQPFTLAKDPAPANRRVTVLVQEGRMKLKPSKEYVLHLNRDRPRFVQLLESLAEPAWIGVYDRIEAAADPQSVLTERILNEPQIFAHYKALADYYTREGRVALSNLTLGLGYLRAHKLRSIARGKLQLASDTDPLCPGLAEAFAELNDT